MLPYPVYAIAQALHEERIRAARLPVAEWIGVAVTPKRKPLAAGLRQYMRTACARALRRLAASVDPHGVTANA